MITHGATSPAPCPPYVGGQLKRRLSQARNLLAEGAINVQVVGADSLTHQSWILTSCQPRVDFGTQGFAVSEFPFVLGQSVDIVLGHWPNRIVFRDHTRDKFFDLAG